MFIPTPIIIQHYWSHPVWGCIETVAALIIFTLQKWIRVERGIKILSPWEFGHLFPWSSVHPELHTWCASRLGGAGISATDNDDYSCYPSSREATTSQWLNSHKFGRRSWESAHCRYLREETFVGAFHCMIAKAHSSSRSEHSTAMQQCRAKLG